VKRTASLQSASIFKADYGRTADFPQALPELILKMKLLVRSGRAVDQQSAADRPVACYENVGNGRLRPVFW
jgi:hypothetical protein